MQSSVTPTHRHRFKTPMHASPKALWISVAFAVFLTCALPDMVHCQSISLNFNNEIVLASAIYDVSFDVTDEFQTAVNDAVNKAAGSNAPITTKVHSVPPNLVVLSSAWSTGAADAVETTISSLTDTFTLWRDTPSSTIYSSLNEICVSSIGHQPSVISVTNTCSFSDSPVTPSTVGQCNRSLPLTFLIPQSATMAVNASELQQVLCQILDTDCGLISCATAGSETITLSQETVMPTEILPSVVTTYTVVSCKVYAADRNVALVTLVNYANHASVLSSQRISYIRVNDVQVYYEGHKPRFEYVGTTSQCLPHYWYLIFLIILVPVILIAGQRIYLWGRRSGKRSVLECERDIRAGAHASVNPWGGYGMPGYGMNMGMGSMQMQPPGFGPQGFDPQGGFGQPGDYGPPGGVAMPQQQQQGGYPFLRGMNGQWQGGGGDYQDQQNQLWGNPAGGGQPMQQFWSSQQKQQMPLQQQQQSWFQGKQQAYSQQW